MPTDGGAGAHLGKLYLPRIDRSLPSQRTLQPAIARRGADRRAVLLARVVLPHVYTARTRHHPTADSMLLRLLRL